MFTMVIFNGEKVKRTPLIISSRFYRVKVRKFLPVRGQKIAATLLKKGLTVHSLFRLRIPIVETSTCNIPPTSNRASFLMEQDLIACNEVNMVPKHALEAIEKASRDIANNDSLFGGKVNLLSGDFRQILPVLRRARHAEIIIRGYPGHNLRVD